MSPVKDHQARTVPIPRTVVDELTKLHAQSARSELVFPSANFHAAAKPQVESAARIGDT